MHAWGFGNLAQNATPILGSKYGPNFGVTFCFFLKQDKKKRDPKNGAQNTAPFLGSHFGPAGPILEALARSLACSLARSLARLRSHTCSVAGSFAI